MSANNLLSEKKQKSITEETNTYRNHNTVTEYYRWQENPKDVVKESTAKKHRSNLNNDKKNKTMM